MHSDAASQWQGCGVAYRDSDADQRHKYAQREAPARASALAVALFEQDVVGLHKHAQREAPARARFGGGEVVGGQRLEGRCEAQLCM